MIKDAAGFPILENAENDNFTQQATSPPYQDNGFFEVLNQINQYLEKTIPDLTALLATKQCEIDTLKTVFENMQIQGKADTNHINLLLDKLQKLRHITALDYRRNK